MPVTRTKSHNEHRTGEFTVLASKFRVLDDTDPTKVAKFVCSSITANSVSEITIPDSDDTAVFLTATQTLTNKTLTAPTLNNCAVLSVDDDNFTITESGDQTAILRFETSGITTATTRTVTAQDANGTMGLTGKSRTVLLTGIGKVGAGAGWAVGAAANTGYLATMAASQTAGTFVVQIPYVGVGDTITGVYPIAQIESAGNTVTLDFDLRAHTNTAADPGDASVLSGTQISVTADTAVGIAHVKTGTHVVLATNSYYILLTGTTGASCDIILLGAAVVFTDTSGS